MGTKFTTGCFSSPGDFYPIKKSRNLFFFVQILEKIRSFGTSVTYFGGQMIRCSVGPLVSPTTHAILEEIGQKQPNGVPCTRSFDEFYKKYKETTKQRKVGRTRSFAQDEMFQKSNVFTNSEIEQHKAELETAFGIRRPKGKPLQITKGRLGKTLSLDSRLQSLERAIAENNLNMEKTFDIKIPKQKEEPKMEASKKIQHYFDYNTPVRQPNSDMEFEEFQIFENISGKLDKTVDKQKVESPKIEHENSENMGSVKEKRNSWEEAIQQKRLSVENKLNERKDGSEKRGSTDGSCSSTEDIITNYETKSKQDSSESESNNEHQSSECSSVSTQSIDFGNETTNQDTWGRQAQLRKKSEEFGKRRNSLESSKKSDENVTGTWKRFVESRKHSSTENLAQIRRSSYETSTGSRRNSVKKLVDIDGREFCQEIRKHSAELRKRSMSENSEKQSIRSTSSSITDVNCQGARHSVTEKTGVKEDTDYKITIKISQTENEAVQIGNDKFEEIVINDSEPMDSLELYFPKQDNGEDKEKHSDSPVIETDEKITKEVEKSADSEPIEYKRRFDRNRHYKPQSRWPMETTVVVDMEKNEEAEPKLISHGKSNVKTTRRLF